MKMNVYQPVVICINSAHSFAGINLMCIVGYTDSNLFIKLDYILYMKVNYLNG